MSRVCVFGLMAVGIVESGTEVRTGKVTDSGPGNAERQAGQAAITVAHEG